MSLKGGVNKSSGSLTQNTTQSTNATTTTTPNAPSWVSDLAGNFAGQIPNVKTSVAPLSGLQQSAVDGLSGLNFGGLFGQAAGLANGAASDLESFDPSALRRVQSWLNPFLGEVVGATQADLDFNDGRIRAQQALDQANSKAFGGSGAALTRALTEGELERARGTTLGNLRMGAFDSAANNAQQDTNRELQALASRASVASQLAGIGSNGLGLQADLGAMQRDIDNQRANSSLTDLATMIGLFGQLPAGLLTGQTSNTVGSGTSNSSGTSKGKTSGVQLGVSWNPTTGFGG